MTLLRFFTLVSVAMLGAVGCGESHSSTDAATLDGSGGDAIVSDGARPDGAPDGSTSCSACAPGAMCCPGCGSEVICATGTVCPDVDCPPPPLCGGAVCGAGQTCCPGCDGEMLCTDGSECVPSPCPPYDPCTPMDARGEGACRALLGYVWNGRACSSIGGCECVGTHCYRLYGSQEECEAATRSCPASTGRLCGTRGAPPCDPGDFCDFPPSSFCGAADGGGTCTERPEACDDIFDPVCGCDGMDYENACSANGAGVSVASRGPCASVPPEP